MLIKYQQKKIMSILSINALQAIQYSVSNTIPKSTNTSSYLMKQSKAYCLCRCNERLKSQTAT